MKYACRDEKGCYKIVLLVYSLQLPATFFNFLITIFTFYSTNMKSENSFGVFKLEICIIYRRKNEMFKDQRRGGYHD